MGYDGEGIRKFYYLYLILNNYKLDCLIKKGKFNEILVMSRLDLRVLIVIGFYRGSGMVLYSKIIRLGF